MIGQTIAHYRVTAKLGAGGMGEVYRATDTKLGRDVALKVLPEAFAADAQRMQRFQREAQVLASLNHPNIAAIYGLEHHDRIQALAMELVEGPTLAERIAKGPIPRDEALPIARQIAEALEYAHERGIIHRDLKPANIKFTPDNKVKLLDFGLAKALQGETVQADPSNSPTISVAATKMGVILGTAAYMSPEQAKGKTVDRRADIWSFGVVLFEMLTGRQLFTGETASEVMAHVITEEPDFTAVGAGAPRSLPHLLRRCLAKDPGVRLRDIGEARIALAEILAHPAVDREAGAAVSPAGHKARNWLLAAGVTAGLVLGAAGSWILLSGSGKSVPAGARGASRFSITLPPEAPFYVEYYPGLCLAISRDGTQVVYSSRGKARRLYLRRLGELEVRPIAGTEGGTAPFFSPDGEWVAFFTFDGALKKVSLAGGNPITLVRGMPYATFVIGSWTDDGQIVFDTWNEGLRAVSASGGAVKTLTSPPDEWHQDPQPLPGSDTILFLAIHADTQRVETLSMKAGTRKTILENASHARYLNSGHLLFVRDGGLMVAPFDVRRLAVTGPATPVSLNVMFDYQTVFAPTPQLAVSLTGTLVYAPGWSTGGRATLVWVDRNGRAEEFATLPVTLPLFQLSPEGERLALASRMGAAVRIQILDLNTKTLTRVADVPEDVPMSPKWSPDGRRVYFTRYGTHQGTILAQDLESSSPPQPVFELRGTYLACTSVSNDGRFLFYSYIREAATGIDIWVVDLSALGTKEAVRPFLATPELEYDGVVSPDGRWVAYGSGESGTSEIYVRRFPGGESKQRVSTEGGVAPQWSGDGRELFYQAEDGSKMMVAAVQDGRIFRVGAPRVLFEGAYAVRNDAGPAYAVSRDGRRFLMVRQPQNPLRATELIVTQDWFAELQAGLKK